MIHGFAVGNTNSGGGGGGITAINISAGTTSSNTAAVTFADGNGVSFGYDGSNITATVATNYQSQGAYLTTAMASNRGSDFVQATANFFGTNASGTINSNAISVSVGAQSAQSFKISAGLSSSNVTAVTFSNANGVSFGYDGTNITATVQTNYLTTAMASNRGSDFVQATAVFHGTNASGTIASGDVSVSVAAQSVQTQNNVDISLSGNTAGALALISSGTAILAGGNNITLSQNGQSVTISGPNTVAQTVQTQNCVDLSLSGNTTGTLTLISSGTAILAGGNNITLSQNGQSVTISAFNQSVQTQNCVDLTLGGNTTGTLTLISSGTAFLAGGNNITLSQNGQSVTISCGAAGTGFTSTSTAGSNIVATLNTSGLSMGVPNYLTTAEQSHQFMSFYANFPFMLAGNTTGLQSNSWYVFPVTIQEKITISYLRLMGFNAFTTTTIATSAVNNVTGASTSFNETIQWNAVLYTMGTGANSRSLQYVYSNSAGVTWQATVSQASTSNASQQSISQAMTYPANGFTTNTVSTQYSVSATNGPISSTAAWSLDGGVYLDIPWATSLSAGNYWMALNRFTGTVGGKNIDYGSNSHGASQLAASYHSLGVGGNSGWQMGIGSWTTNVQQTTSSIALASLTISASHFLPYLQFINQA